LTKKRNRLKFWALIIKYKIRYLFSNPLYNNGVHLIEAPSGTGKTLLMNIIIQNTVDADRDFMYCNINQFEASKVQPVDIFDMFQDGMQKYRLALNINDRRCKGLIIDEINANFNRRLNSRKAYNDIFVGLMEFAVTARHQGLNKLYFIGQDIALQDGQLQQIFKYRHLIYATKRYNYKLYLDTGEVALLPKKLKVIHFVKTGDKDPRGMPIFVPFKTTKIRVDYDKHVKTYNHKGYAQKYSTLPILPLKD